MKNTIRRAAIILSFAWMAGCGSNNTYNPSLSGAAAVPSLPKIAFESERDGNRQVYVMNADGTGVTRLTNDDGTDGDPAWSSNRNKIAFYTARDGGKRQIYVMNPDGSGQTRITNNPARDDEP